VVGLVLVQEIGAQVGVLADCTQIEGLKIGFDLVRCEAQPFLVAEDIPVNVPGIGYREIQRQSARTFAFNVGRDNDPVTMERVAQLACRLTNAPESLIRIVDPPQRQTVVKRLATERVRALGWEPEVELHHGMQKTLEWIRAEMREAGYMDRDNTSFSKMLDELEASA